MARLFAKFRMVAFLAVALTPVAVETPDRVKLLEAVEEQHDAMVKALRDSGTRLRFGGVNLPAPGQLSK